MAGTVVRIAQILARFPAKLARRPILLLLVTSTFVVVAILLLTLSGTVLHGWWQSLFLELGVGVLIAGVVDVAILGALHGLIEGVERAQRSVEQ